MTVPLWVHALVPSEGDFHGAAEWLVDPIISNYVLGNNEIFYHEDVAAEVTDWFCYPSRLFNDEKASWGT